MTYTLRIAVRGRDLSDSEKKHITECAAGLETFFPRILGCEVRIEGPGAHHRHGTHRARIILDLPTRRIVVSRRKGDSLREALADAFRAAGRRLEDHARKIRGDVKRHSVFPDEVAS